MVSQIETGEAFEALFKRYDEVSKTIAFPYPKFDEESGGPPKKNGARRSAVQATARAAAAVTAPVVGARRPVKAQKF